MRIQLITRKTELITAAFFKAIIEKYYSLQNKEVWKFLGFFISFKSIEIPCVKNWELYKFTTFYQNHFQFKNSIILLSNNIVLKLIS